ncbi:MAG TPA: hypothetical protein VF533_10675 [Solirubrobacteraceae bacterium]|jgi:hypothetical protein
MRNLALGLTLSASLALAAPGVASAACYSSTPGRWTAEDPAGDQWFSPTHTDVAALHVAIDDACRLTLSLDFHGALDPDANDANFDLDFPGGPDAARGAYVSFPRPDFSRPGGEVWMGRGQSGGIGYRPEPRLTPVGLAGLSGTLDTFGITTPGEIRVRARVDEYPREDGGVGPTGTGDSVPNRVEWMTIPLEFTTEPPAPPVVPAVPPPSQPPAGPDETAPTVSGLVLRPAGFRAERAGAARAARRTALARAAGRFALSEAATVTFKLQKRTRRGKFVWVGRSFDHAGTQGANEVRFAGRLLNRRLKPGVYRLSARARDGAGNAGAVRRVRFRIR